MRAMGAHGAHEFASARRESNALRNHLRDDFGIQSFQQRDALAKSGLKFNLAAHGALGDRRHMLFHANIIGELVDTFLPDHGRIHIGQKKFFAAGRSRLHDHIDGCALQRRADTLGEVAVVCCALRCEGKVGGNAGCEPIRFRRRRQRAGGSVEQSLIEQRAGGIGNECGDQRHERAFGTVSRISALLIAGPTASGKSALAIRVAQAVGGVVVNADSMQVYGDLRIITARPTLEEEASAPHRLFGHVDGAVNYSVGRFLADVEPVLADIRGQGRLPILTGGTGMYFKALLRGLSDIPAVPEAVRAQVRAESEGLSAPELHARLAARDPQTAARLRPSDPQRILRALEVFEATGQPLASFQAKRGPALLDSASAPGIFLAPPREVLKARIDRRFLEMMQTGAVEEVERLAARGLDPALPVMRAHGVPGLIDYLRGNTTLEAAIERGQKDTRAYSKRQFTFVRHQLPEFAMVSPEKAWEAVQQVI